MRFAAQCGALLAAPATVQDVRTPRLVAIDIDGTLFDPLTRTISPRVRDTVRRVADSGAHVVLATGRSMLGTVPVLRELDLTSGVALCSNGAVRLDAASGEPLAVETFDPGPVCTRLAEHLPGALFAAELVGVGSLITAPFPEGTLIGETRVVSLSELAAKPTPRLIAHWAEHTPEETLAVVGSLDLPGCHRTIDHYEPWVTVVPDGVTKGSALEKLRTELGIPGEDTLAIGDGDNDVEMVSWAAHGIAMAQGPASVRAAADEIAPAVEQDGLADVLSRWF